MTSFRRMAAATALTLALPGLALAQPWSDPPARRLAEAAPAAPVSTPVSAPVSTPAAKAAEPAPAARVAAATPAPVAAPEAVRKAPARAEAPRPRREARPTLRTARYAGGAGAVWQASDGHAFSGSYGGCRFTGFAGPGGFRLVRGC